MSCRRNTAELSVSVNYVPGSLYEDNFKCITLQNPYFNANDLINPLHEEEEYQTKYFARL